MSLNWKVFPVQRRRIFEKYQNLTKWRSYEKKSVFLPIKWSFFQCQIVNFHQIKNIPRHCGVNIFNTTQYKFQVHRINCSLSYNVRNVKKSHFEKNAFKDLTIYRPIIPASGCSVEGCHSGSIRDTAVKFLQDILESINC